MKYQIALKRFWWTWFKQDIMRLYYRIFYKFNMSPGFQGTLLPNTGQGKYVSVYSKGQIIQIKHESGYPNIEFDEIRIIPYQPNHGVMIERFKNGVMADRKLMDLEQFNKSVIFALNVVELASRT